MHPILFSIGDWPVYSRRAAGGGLPDWPAAGRDAARKAGVDPARVMDLGIYLIIAALVGAKLMLIAVDWDYFRIPAARTVLAGSRRRRVLWRLDRGRGRRFVAGPPLQTAGMDDCRSHGARYRPWTRRRSIRLLVGGMLLRAPHRRGLGDHVHGPARRPERRDAARYSAPSHAAIRRRCRAHYPCRAAVTERKGRPFAGRTFWLYLLLYGVSRFIIEFYRGDPNRGTVMAGLSTSQFVSLLLVPGSLLMLAYLRRRGPGRATLSR